MIYGHFVGSNVKNRQLIFFNLFLRSLIMPINIAALSSRLRYSVSVQLPSGTVAVAQLRKGTVPCEVHHAQIVYAILLSKIWTENLQVVRLKLCMCVSWEGKVQTHLVMIPQVFIYTTICARCFDAMCKLHSEKRPYARMTHTNSQAKRFSVSSKTSDKKRSSD